MSIVFRLLRSRKSKGSIKLFNYFKSLEGIVDAKKIKFRGSHYRGSNDHFILNWGCTTRKNISEDIPIINEPHAVALAVNKLKTFRSLNSNTPRWTTSAQEAESWFRLDMTDCIYCRTKLSSSHGDGIVIARSVDDLVPAPLYVEGVNDISRELRVHVFDGKVIDFSQKKRRNRVEGEPPASEDIRSYVNGWIFAREGVTITEDIADVAINAIGSLGLMFGAVDIGVDVLGRSFIYEINTAPGLMGTTEVSYRNAISKIIGVEADV